MLFIQTILLCIENCFWCRLLLSQQLFFGIFILISRTVTFVYLLLLPIQSDYNLFIIFNTFIFAHQLKSICFLYFVPYWVVNWLNWIQSPFVEYILLLVGCIYIMEMYSIDWCPILWKKTFNSIHFVWDLIDLHCVCARIS